MKYKLNKERDVDTDDGVYILNLPAGFRFDESGSDVDRSHVRGYDTMADLRADVKTEVVKCQCPGCLAILAKAKKGN